MFNTREARNGENTLAISVRIPNAGPGATLFIFSMVREGFWVSSSTGRTFSIDRLAGEAKTHYKERVARDIHEALTKETK